MNEIGMASGAEVRESAFGTLVSSQGRFEF
jgi:hypothetical protein